MITDSLPSFSAELELDFLVESGSGFFETYIQIQAFKASMLLLKKILRLFAFFE